MKAVPKKVIKYKKEQEKCFRNSRFSITVGALVSLDETRTV